MYFRILLVTSCMAVGGCGLVPPAVSIASFAADAFSYAVSGKSVSDHGMSAVMQENCAFLNLVKGEAVCAPGPHPDIVMVAPREESERSLLAMALNEADTGSEASAPSWTRPADDLPLEYASAGAVSRELLLLPPAALPLEPVASGPVDVLASLGSVKPPA